MEGEPGDRRTSAEPASSEDRPGVPLPAEPVLVRMLRAGLTVEQISRLVDLRVRVLRGACVDDDAAEAPEPAAIRRLEFARWLVQTGRLREV